VLKEGFTSLSSSSWSSPLQLPQLPQPLLLDLRGEGEQKLNEGEQKLNDAALK
jgi:hypothetical protein